MWIFICICEGLLIIYTREEGVIFLLLWKGGGGDWMLLFRLGDGGVNSYVPSFQQHLIIYAYQLKIAAL